MAEIRSINALRAERHNDNTMLSPTEALQDAIASIERGERCDSLMVLMLDKGEHGMGYCVSFEAVNLRASDMLALLEVAKLNVLRSMNLLPED